MSAPATDAVLDARQIAVSFNRPGALARAIGRHGRHPVLLALDGVDLTLRRGESLALVGESGSGKTTLANVLVGRLAPNAGTVDFEGARLTSDRNQMQRRRIQMVFQDPYSSLNPRMTDRKS